MIALHEKQLDDRFVRHWANEVDENSVEYETCIYRIRQIETGVVYDEAIDVIPCRYTYEVTDEKIDNGDAHNGYTDAPEQNGYTEADLQEKSNAELIDILAEMGISANMNKANMIRLILSAQVIE